jgi:hypothetical protein
LLDVVHFLEGLLLDDILSFDGAVLLAEVSVRLLNALLQYCLHSLDSFIVLLSLKPT